VYKVTARAVLRFEEKVFANMYLSKSWARRSALGTRRLAGLVAFLVILSR
jgi:hypothetical protein